MKRSVQNPLENPDLFKDSMESKTCNFQRILNGRRLKWIRRKSKKSAAKIHIEQLKRIFILNELKGKNDFLQILLNYCYIQNVVNGETIYQEGDDSSEMYIVLEGEIRVYKHSSSDEQFLLAELSGSKASFFGEMGLIQDHKRAATIQAESDAKLLVLSRASFIRMARKQPDIAMGLIFSICRVLSERLQRTNADLAYLYDALAYEASEG